MEKEKVWQEVLEAVLDAALVAVVVVGFLVLSL